MKLIALILPVTFAVAACNEAGLQFGAPGPKVSDQKPASETDDDSAAEPVMVAGAYLVCWPHGNAGVRADGTEDIGCRLESEVSGNKVEGNPADNTWSIENSSLNLAMNEIRVCSKTDDCHIIIRNLANRASKRLVVKDGEDTFTEGLGGELKTPPSERPKLNLLAGILPPQTNGDDLPLSIFAALAGTVAGNGQVVATGISGIIDATQISEVNVEAKCKEAVSKSTKGFGDAAGLADAGTMCFIKDNKYLRHNSAQDCYLMNIKYGSQTVLGIFNGKNTDMGLKAKVQALQAAHPCK